MSSREELIQIEASSSGLLKSFIYNNFTYTSLFADRSAEFPKRISGAVHLIGIQPYKSKQYQSNLTYLDCSLDKLNIQRVALG